MDEAAVRLEGARRKAKGKRQKAKGRRQKAEGRIIAPMDPVAIRDVEPSQLEDLTDLWLEGWRDGHLEIVPADLAALRTRESFRARLVEALAEVRVAEIGGALAGFYLLRDDELYQFYVARAARGTGVAASLMADAEARLRARGVRMAWLTCAVGNARAARFYEKAGWMRSATFTDTLTTPAGPYPLEVWRFEKTL
jgi:GNAT superfamily N-acetyltransferase